MNSISRLTKRIHRLIGLDAQVEDDFSFFEPRYNEQGLQFFYICDPSEYRELERWDRKHLVMTELSANTGIRFELDDDGDFAVATVKNKKRKISAHVVIDLRESNICMVYYYGDPKVWQKINLNVRKSELAHPCFLSSGILQKIADELEKVTSVHYGFEQSNSMYLAPAILKGVQQGDLVHELVREQVEKGGIWFNIEKIAGHTSDGAQGTVVIDANGFLSVDSCRLSTFMETVEKLYRLLTKKYAQLEQRHLLLYEEDDTSRLVQVKGEPIEVSFEPPIERMEGLIKAFTGGGKPLNFIGNSERISRKLWRVVSTDFDNGQQVEIELSNSTARIIVRDRRGLPLVDRIEAFIRQSICATVKGDFFDPALS